MYRCSVTAWLWLARKDCIDLPLPWQAPQDSLAPGRVAQAFAGILAAIGTPALAPKPRGKSPGRVKGYTPASRPRVPAIRRLKNEPLNASNPSNPRTVRLRQQLNFEQDCI